MKKIHLLIIDPQNSFAKEVDLNDQQKLHDGELCVPGAWEDMERLAAMIDRIGDKIDDITVTLDSHHQLHIAHPMWWKLSNGDRPGPLTQVREDNGVFIGTQFDASGNAHDVGEMMVSNPGFHAWTLDYIRTLTKEDRYPHMIWPEHCLIGTPGHNVVEPLQNALFKWESENLAFYNKVTKGSNYRTEHFSAVQSEVVDPDDATTQPNAFFIDEINKADIILLAGEASSHCVANTLRDMVTFFGSNGDEFVKKVVCLTDAMSPVAGFEDKAQEFIDDMTKLGMKTTTTVDYLAI
jgi:nicotinamidase-related amidase